MGVTSPCSVCGKEIRASDREYHLKSGECPGPAERVAALEENESRAADAFESLALALRDRAKNNDVSRDGARVLEIVAEEIETVLRDIFEREV